MKRKLWIIPVLAALLAALFCGAAIAEQSGACGDNVTYSFDSAAGTLTVSGTGPMTDYTLSAPAPWVDERALIQTVVIENGVTRVGSRAFQECANLDSISIPDSVTGIGNYAFLSCTGLTV